MDEKKGFLSRIFNAETIIKTALITIPLVITGNIFWQVVLDPLFFPAVHGYQIHEDMFAMVEMMQQNFGWVHEMIGFSGDDGFLQTEFMQTILEPYKEGFESPAEALQNNAPQVQAPDDIFGF